MCAFGSRHLVPARIFERDGWIAPTIASVGVSLLFFGLILGFVGGSPPPDEWDLQVPDRPVTLFRPKSRFPLLLCSPLAYLAGQDPVAYLVTPAGAGP